MQKIKLSQDATLHFGGSTNSMWYEKLMRKIACFKEGKR